MKHNNVLPNQHFRKAWAERVKTWLDQAGRKKSRRVARAAKAAKVAPRPAAGAVRPAVRCATVRYNTRVRAGRGFTLAELRAAGVGVKLAPTIGVSVDHRRRNKSEGAFQENVARLKTYLEKLVLFPRKGGAKHLHAGEADAATRKAATQLTGDVLPINTAAPAPAFIALTEELKGRKAFRTLRQERINAKLHGRRAKKAAEAPAKPEGGKEEA
mgnify:CR=1 FL=1